jgi:hypothetical protein
MSSSVDASWVNLASKEVVGVVELTNPWIAQGLRGVAEVVVGSQKEGCE